MAEHLAHYRKRGPSDSARVRSKTRRTRRVKHGIIGVVAVLVMVMIVWPLTNMGKRSFKVNLASSATQAGEEKPRMLKPRLHGLDEDGQPYSITAAEAVQEDKDNVQLQVVQGDMYLKHGEWVSLHSDSGHYNVEGKTLDLLGSVNLLMDTGYEVATEAAHVVLRIKEVQGDVQVQVQGPLGTLTADGFNLQGQTNTIIFRGNVHLRAFPKAGKKG